jgi:hypothetical protein
MALILQQLLVGIGTPILGRHPLHMLPELVDGEGGGVASVKFEVVGAEIRGGFWSGGGGSLTRPLAHFIM